MANLKISVDGSYVDDEHIYGAVVVQNCETKQLLTYLIRCNNKELATSRNVYGEVAAATFGLVVANEALECDPNVNVTIIHDYEGVKKWATGEWKSKKPISQHYVAVLNSMPRLKDRITFIHQKSHTGITSENSYLNHLADRIAALEVKPGFTLEALF